MSVERNVETVRTLAEAVTRRDWIGFEALIDPDCEWTSVASGREMRGVRELLDGWRAFTEAFPDLTVEIVTAIAQGDAVANEWTASGTHLGPLPRPDGGAYPPTGRSFRRRGVGIAELREGRVIRYRDYFDRQTMAEQLQLD